MKGWLDCWIYGWVEEYIKCGQRDGWMVEWRNGWTVG